MSCHFKARPEISQMFLDLLNGSSVGVSQRLSKVHHNQLYRKNILIFHCNHGDRDSTLKMFSMGLFTPWAGITPSLQSSARRCSRGSASTSLLAPLPPKKAPAARCSTSRMAWAWHWATPRSLAWSGAHPGTTLWSSLFCKLSCHLLLTQVPREACFRGRKLCSYFDRFSWSQLFHYVVVVYHFGIFCLAFSPPTSSVSINISNPLPGVTAQCSYLAS